MDLCLDELEHPKIPATTNEHLFDVYKNLTFGQV
jgi:hypothetical protein